jgi:hypothetical protein
VDTDVALCHALLDFSGRNFVAFVVLRRHRCVGNVLFVVAMRSSVSSMRCARFLREDVVGLLGR